MAEKGSRILGYVSPYLVPYPVSADGSYSGAVATEGEDGTEAAPYVGVAGPYVDTRGPYVDSSGPYVEITGAYSPQLASFTNVPNAPVPTPAEVVNLAASSIHRTEVRPSVPIDNDDAAPRFWIALMNHWVYTATAYWVEGETMHYITTQGVHNQVPLRSVDWQTFTRLNAPRP